MNAQISEKYPKNSFRKMYLHARFDLGFSDDQQPKQKPREAARCSEIPKGLVKGVKGVG